MTRALSLLLLTWVPAMALAAACNAKVETVLDDPARADSGVAGEGGVKGTPPSGTLPPGQVPPGPGPSPTGTTSAPPSSTTDPPTPAPCTFGMDQTCNSDPAMSSLAGHCNPDGSCTCTSVPLDPQTGRCGLSAGTFPNYVAGTWLIGWYGGLDHFSWVRLSGGPSQGQADFISESSTNPAHAHYWTCDGVGSWAITQKPDTIYLYFPANCTVGNWEQAYTFKSVLVHTAGQYPTSAIADATFDTLPGNQSLVGFKFPDQQCNTAFTSCTDPFP